MRQMRVRAAFLVYRQNPTLGRGSCKQGPSARTIRTLAVCILQLVNISLKSFALGFSTSVSLYVRYLSHVYEISRLFIVSDGYALQSRHSRLGFRRDLALFRDVSVASHTVYGQIPLSCGSDGRVIEQVAFASLNHPPGAVTCGLTAGFGWILRERTSSV